jgi:hypothetical protein
MVSAFDSAVAEVDAPTTELPHERGAQPWMDLIPDDQWEVYRDAIAIARDTGLPFMLGGGFALAAYTGRWRNTKDIDFYVLPHQRNHFIDAMTRAGFSDYYEQRSYDRGWIYRSFRDGTIVDLIWAMANRRAEAAESWFKNATELTVRGEKLSVIAPEELLWCKMYVMQRDHSDWPDILNLLHAVGPQLDWARVLQHVQQDEPVLRSLLTLFGWLSPERAAQLPEGLRRRLQLAVPKQISEDDESRRIRLLDSRNWFAAHLPVDQVLEV